MFRVMGCLLLSLWIEVSRAFLPFTQIFPGGYEIDQDIATVCHKSIVLVRLKSILR